MSKIRICFFADGESVHTQRWLREMVARGFEVTLVTRRPWSFPGVQVVTLAGSWGALEWFRRVPEIRRIVRQLRPDIVHGHYITSYGFWAALCGVRPLVLTAWGSDILVSPKHSILVRWLTRWLLSQAELITADSLDTLEEMRTYSPHGRLEQVQWGVDLERIRPHTKNSHSVLNVISLRSWEQNYNIDLVLRAFADFRQAMPGTVVHLHLLGGGALEEALRAQVLSMGIAEQVTFHGRVDEAALLEIMAQADISISVPTSDATAMSLLESMAAGLPVVVSDLPANRQWVNAAGGYIVPPGDEKALTQALLELARDASLRLAMGARNRAMVEAKASRRVEMDRMSVLYKELFNRRGRANEVH